MFDDVYKEYFIYYKKRHKKQGFETMARNFKNHILPYFTNTYVNDLTKADIISWQNKIYDKKFNNSFNNNLYTAFSGFIKYCIVYSYLDENIVLQVGNFKKQYTYKEHKIYSLSQFKKFRKYVKNNIYKQYFNFMYFYGTRPSEALALRYSDIENNYVHIRHNLQRRGKREIDTPKNRSSIRTFKINIITRLRLWYLKCYYDKKYNYENYDYFIFGGIKPLSTTTIDRIKRKASKDANLFEITMHEFRHSCCSRRIHKGDKIDQVSKDLGHSNTSTTLNTYLHLEQEKRVTSTLFTKYRVLNRLRNLLKTLSHYIITRFFM